jgi:hypothetical protein
MPYWTYIKIGGQWKALKSFSSFEAANHYIQEQYNSWIFNTGAKKMFAIFYGNEQII